MKMTRVEVLLPDMAVGKFEAILMKTAGMPTHHLREDRVVRVNGGRQANYVKVTLDLPDKSLVEVVEEAIRRIPFMGLVWEISIQQVEIKGAE